MATLTITTTGGTTHTYPGLTVEEAQRQRNDLRRARADFLTSWNITDGTKTDEFTPQAVTTISVDTA